MFRWYQSAELCYAYLSDVRDLADVAKSKWYTRGWTLQELLAPTKLVFYSATWSKLTDRHACADQIAHATGIPADLLLLGWSSTDVRPCAAEILTWASGRSTTRVEDASYCLLGLFNVNMPLLYGEGAKAFTRLQHEILRKSDDQSLFAWNHSDNMGLAAPSGLLALSSQAFRPRPTLFDGFEGNPMSWTRRKAHMVDSEGVSAEVSLLCVASRIYLAILNAKVRTGAQSALPSHVEIGSKRLAITVKRLDAHERYSRHHINVKVPYQRLSSGDSIFIDIHDGVGVIAGDFKDKLQVIKVVDDLRDAESKSLSTTYCAAFRADVDGVSMANKMIMNRPVDLVRHDIIQLVTPTPDDCGLVGIINCKGPVRANGSLPSHFERYRRPRIHYLGVGFDADFNPMLTFVLDSHKDWRQKTEWEFFSLNFLLSRLSSKEGFIENEGSWNWTSAVLPGGQRTSYVDGRGILFNQYDGKCLVLKLQLSAADTMGRDARIYDWITDATAEKFCVDVSISRQEPCEPWHVQVRCYEDWP